MLKNCIAVFIMQIVIEFVAGYECIIPSAVRLLKLIRLIFHIIGCQRQAQGYE